MVSLLGHCNQSFYNKDTVGGKYYKSKFKNYGAIIVAMSVAVSEIENETAKELGGTTEARISVSKLL